MLDNMVSDPVIVIESALMLLCCKAGGLQELPNTWRQYYGIHGR
jgi:hypothetical protein